LLQRTLNLGILAHVNAGKTTLTERLLYAAGVIDAVGSVDDGTAGYLARHSHAHQGFAGQETGE
jgi:translation elongation factor EF-G